MKAHVLFTTLACAATLRAQTPPEAAPEDPRDAARREAWRSAVLIVSLLEQGDNTAFPGIRAWLADFQQTAATTPPPEAGQPFPAVDADALVTHNPHFWSAFYEMAPGDPGFALLHSALLLSGGEAQRASALAAFGLQRPAIPEEIKRGLLSVIAQCSSAQAHSAELVRAGVKLHDCGDFAGAVQKFDAALAEWPGNGCAHYERGSTLRMKAIADARRTAAASDSLDPPEVPPDPPETAASFALARRHNPLNLLAYQGDDPQMLTALMVLVRTGLPVWEMIHKHPEQPLKPAHLRDLCDACQAAAIDDFALVLRQLVVAANRHYATDDSDCIQESLHRLAPASLTPALLARVSGETRAPVRQLVVPTALETPDLAQAGENDPASQESKGDTSDKPKGKGKSAHSGKGEKASSKSRRHLADEEDSPTPKKHHAADDDSSKKSNSSSKKKHHSS